MPYLILNPGAADNKIFTLKEGNNFLGRARENDIVVLHPSLSRQHARIDLIGDHAAIMDLQSRNGTFVNGSKIQQSELHDRDQIRCGDAALVFVQGLMSFVQQDHNIVKQMSPDATRIIMKDLLFEETAKIQAGALKIRTEVSEDRARDKLQILLKVSELLSSPEDIDRLLNKILDLLFQIMDVDRAALLLLDDNTGDLDLKAIKVTARETTQFYSRFILNYVMEHGVGVLSSDARLDPRFEKAHSIVQQSIRSLICVPLKPRDKVTGVLYVDNLSASNLYTEEELEFLTGFATQAAIAIDNSKLYKRIESEAVLRNNFMRFFPPKVVQEIAHAQDLILGAIETEITALFSDISSFTEMSARMEPREIVDLLNAYFPHMAEIVFRYDGTLEKYIGDALMAIWGAPFQHPDDPSRAVRAAIEMQYAVKRFNAEWGTPRGMEIQIHIGLNTGKVAAGNIGSKDYIQYATIGDTTNVTSRICGVAQSHEIMISESTRLKLNDPLIPLEKIDPVKVKGKDEPLQLYRVLWEEVSLEMLEEHLGQTRQADDSSGFSKR